jgi:hypothetical protein
MRARTALILVVLAVVLIGGGSLLGLGPRSPVREVTPPALAFPGLTDKLAGAERVEIVHAGSTLPIVRAPKGTGWGLADRGNYPVKTEKLRELLSGLTELKLQEPRTSDPAMYSRLGVEDPAGKGADSTLVRVLDGKGTALAEIVVGHPRTGASGTVEAFYVRRPGDAQSWLATGHLGATTDLVEWLDRGLLNIEAAKITSVTVDRDGQTLSFARRGDAFDLVAPAEHPKLDEDMVGSVSHALETLNFMDVRPAPAPGTPLGQSVFTTSGGLTMILNATRDGDKIWGTFTVTGDGAAKDEAAKLSAKLTGWAFELPHATESSLLPTLDKLKAAEPPAAPSPAADAPDALPPLLPPTAPAQ